MQVAVAMKLPMRSYFAIAAILTIAFSIEVLHLNYPNANNVFQMHQRDPNTKDVPPDGPITCPTTATKWCEEIGGLPE